MKISSFGSRCNNISICGLWLVLLAGFACESAQISKTEDLNPLEARIAQEAKTMAFAPRGPDAVVATSKVQGNHPRYLGLSPQTRWFLGEYSYKSDTNIRVPRGERYVTGTDLGSSVHLNGRDFFYLGDTFWPGRVECGRDIFDADYMSSAGCAPNACCNDAIVVSDDTNPADGLDVNIPLVRGRNDSLNFKPLIIPGIHDNPSFLGRFWRRNRDPNYTAPGGSGIVHGLLNSSGPRVLVWYSTAVWPQGRISRNRLPFRAPRSYVAVSENGFDFKSLVEDTTGAPLPFSIDKKGAPSKFLCTSPVEITEEQFRKICRPQKDGTDVPGLLCGLPEEYRNKGGILVFGSGRNYRLSPLYLAYISHAHLAMGNGFQTRYATHDSLGEWSWTSKEEEAYPVIGGEYAQDPRFKSDCIQRDGFWGCATAVRDLAWHDGVNDHTGLFGEFSVKLVTDGPQGMEPTLVMLSNHQNDAADIPVESSYENELNLRRYLRTGGVYLRTASLGTPHKWSKQPMHTGSNGYGPYIIDRHTRYDADSGELVLWHVLSLWRGPPLSDSMDQSQYGMATTEVRFPWPVGGVQ